MYSCKKMFIDIDTRILDEFLKSLFDDDIICFCSCCWSLVSQRRRMRRRMGKEWKEEEAIQPQYYMLYLPLHSPKCYSWKLGSCARDVYMCAIVTWCLLSMMAENLLAITNDCHIVELVLIENSLTIFFMERRWWVEVLHSTRSLCPNTPMLLFACCWQFHTCLMELWQFLRKTQDAWAMIFFIQNSQISM